MNVLPMPPRGASPESYYTDYLPRLFAAVMDGVVMGDLRITVAVHVGDETFAINLRDGRLSAQRGAPESAALSCTIAPADLKAQLGDLVPRWVRHTERNLAQARARLARAFARPFDLRRLHDNPGRVALRLIDDAGDATTVDVRIGDGRGPEVEVILREHEILLALAGDARPSVLLGAATQVRGDLAYLTRLVTLARCA